MQKIRFNEPYLTGNELGYIEDVFKRRHFYGNGHYTKRCHELAGAIWEIQTSCSPIAAHPLSRWRLCY